MAKNKEQKDAEKFADENLDSAQIEDLPSSITESYGTGVKDLPGYNIGGRTMRREMHDYTESPVPTKR